MKLKNNFFICLFLILSIGVFFTGCGDSKNNKPDKNSNNEQSPSDNVKKDEVKKEEPKVDPPKEKLDFSKMELTNENIEEVVKSLIGDKLTSAGFITEDGKNILDITYNPGEVWDEKALVKDNANTSILLMESLFTNSKVDKVWVWTQTKMLDAKGNSSLESVINVSLTKENAKDVNWPKFKEMVNLDYNALYNISDSNFIHPAISKNLK